LPLVPDAPADAAVALQSRDRQPCYPDRRPGLYRPGKNCTHRRTLVWLEPPKETN
jgi:hypothetical protein